MKKSNRSSVSAMSIARALAALYILVYFCLAFYNHVVPKAEGNLFYHGEELTNHSSLSKVENDFIYQGGELPEVVVTAQKRSTPKRP